MKAKTMAHKGTDGLIERMEEMERRIRELEARPPVVIVQPPVIVPQPVYPQPWYVPPVMPWYTTCGTEVTTAGDPLWTAAPTYPDFNDTPPWTLTTGQHSVMS